MGAIVLFFNLGGATLFDEDEPKNAACGQEMFRRGDYLVPWFNGELRTDKPILLYWCMLAAFHLGGVSEFTARAASALAGIGAAVVTYHLGRLLFRPSVGFWAAVILLTCLMFDVVARAATPDALFVLLTTASLLAFVWGVQRAGGAGGEVALDSASWEVCRPIERRAFVAMYALMGLAVLAKGPAGFVLPLGTLLVFGVLATVAAQRQLQGAPAETGWRPWLCDALGTNWLSIAARVAWSLRPLLGIAVLAAIVLPWYLAVGLATDGAWLAGFLGHHNLGRFTSALEGHRGPFFYYAIALVIGMFPWSVFFPQAIGQIARSLGCRDERMPSFLFLASWALVVIGIFTLARTKLPNYVLPAYPALALSIGVFMDRWVRHPEKLPLRGFRIALASYAATGAGMVIGLSVAAALLFPRDAWLAAVGLIPLAGAAAAWRFQSRQRSAAAALAFTASAVLLSMALFGVAADVVSSRQTSPAIARLAHQRGGAPLATYEFFEPSLVFYHGGPVTRLHDPQEVSRFVARRPEACVVTTRERLPELAPHLPADMVEVFARPRFLRTDDEVVLLGRAALADGPRDARR